MRFNFDFNFPVDTLKVKMGVKKKEIEFEHK